MVIPNLWQLPEGIGSIADLDGFESGDFWVMDPAAAYVADMVHRAVGGPGTVLDTCAAPGGKTFRLAAHGMRVTATDRDENRLERMAENCHRLRIDVPRLVHDWAVGPHPDLGQFDAVLVDAPCTALGTVRRHPEILWRRQLGDVHAQSVIQRKVLRHASEHVKPGGSLLYSVCSPEPEEGPNVVDSLDGWRVCGEWKSVPPWRDEDAFQAFVLQRDSS